MQDNVGQDKKYETYLNKFYEAGTRWTYGLSDHQISLPLELFNMQKTNKEEKK